MSIEREKEQNLPEVDILNTLTDRTFHLFDEVDFDSEKIKSLGTDQEGYEELDECLKTENSSLKESHFLTVHQLIKNEGESDSVNPVIVDFLVHKDAGTFFSEVFIKLLSHEEEPVKIATLKYCANMFKSEKGKKVMHQNR